MHTSVLERGLARFDRHSWGVALGVAALFFLTLLAAGAVLLLAGKLQFSSLGSGAGPFDILRAIGLVALACLGAAVDLDGVPLSVIPLGALALVGWSSTRLARDALRERTTSLTFDALRVGGALAAMLFLGALVFRFGGEVPVSASPWEAAGLGFVWGSALAALGMHLGARGSKGSLERWVPARTVRRGLSATVPIAVAALVLSLAALLVLIIGRLASETLPRWFGLPDALAAIIYLIAFLPNVLVTVFSLAVGATWRIGAQVNVGGEVVGPLREYSLLDRGDGGPSAFLLLLFVVPLLVSVGAGIRTAARGRDLRSLATTVLISAGTFALGVFVLASISDARLGAGLVRRQGVGLVAVDAIEAGFFTLLWMCVGGALGVVLHGRLKARSRGAV